MVNFTSRLKATATATLANGAFTKRIRLPAALAHDNELGVPQELVVGRVVMRIPYFGWITLFLRENNWGLPVIIGLIYC